MMNYTPGDLLLLAFPFTEGGQTRLRPALVILDTGDADVVVSRVTTQIHRTPHDIPISDWQGAGLLAPSIVRLHKLATLEKTLIRRRLGSLQAADRRVVARLLQQTFGGW